VDIEHLADASGGLAWISGRLFEIQGRLAVQPAEGSELDAGIRILLARSSRRHGQHCQWWRDLLPDSPALNAAGRVRPPSSAWANALDCIEAAPQADAVAVLHEVAVPELAFVLSRLRQAPAPVSDGAFMRTARMVAADLAEEQRDAKGCRPIPGVSSKAEIEELSMSFAGDRREKRWPPLVTPRRKNGYR